VVSVTYAHSQIAANALQSVLVDVWAREHRQRRDQVPEQGQEYNSLSQVGNEQC